MHTIILKIENNYEDIKKIKFAARIINQGGLVAFPTETVYGLGADAFNPIAVKKIFQAKNRPLNDPLIVHIAYKKDIFKLAVSVPEIVNKLIEKFWPGPLTIILKKAKFVPGIVTANLDTVAIRMPNHPIALALIKYSQTPIVAPSANIFGKVSSTTAKAVIEDLYGKIDVIIDSGKTKIGLESTVIDFSNFPAGIPEILRPGAITYEMLKEILGDKIKETKHEKKLLKENIVIGKNSQDKLQTEIAYRSPGMMKRHYSPNAKVIVANTVKEMIFLGRKFLSEGKHVGILTFLENSDKFNSNINAVNRFNIKILGSKFNLKICAKNLFSKLREFDREKTDIILVESMKKVGIGRAIMDRLEKASGMV